VGGGVSGFWGVPPKARSTISVVRLELASLEASLLRISSHASMKDGNLGRSSSNVLRTLNLGFGPQINW
jgi:hypothetical protein